MLNVLQLFNNKVDSNVTCRISRVILNVFFLQRSSQKVLCDIQFKLIIEHTVRVIDFTHSMPMFLFVYLE